MPTKPYLSRIWIIPVAYAVFGILWILLSDRLLYAARLPEEVSQSLQSIKGILYVAISTLLVALITWLHDSSSQNMTRVLAERDERFHFALGSIREAAFDYDIAKQVLHWSYGLRQLLGDVDNDVLTDLGQFRNSIHPDDVGRVVAGFSDVGAGKITQFRQIFRLRTRSGNYLWTEVRAMVIKGTANEPLRLVGVLRDVTERMRFEMDLIASNRALTALSDGNREIVQATSCDAVMQRVCQILVNRAGYKMAWIGQLEESGLLLPVAFAGTTRTYFDQEPLHTDDLNAHRSPITLAAAKCRTINARSEDTERTFTLWSERARHAGQSSCLAVPLLTQPQQGNGSGCFGVIAIYLGAGEVFDEREQLILETLCRDLSFALSVLQQKDKTDYVRRANELSEARLNDTLSQTVMALAATVERRDPYAAGHEARMAEMAIAVANKLGLGNDQLMGIRLAALLHDIGKIGISSEILAKPALLTPAERAMVRQHPQIGHDIIAGIDFPWPVKRVVLEHHERLDGSGYPNGLKGDQICLEARIIAVCDVAEAIMSGRPYRPAHTLTEALAVLSEPGKFDARVVAAFRELAIGGQLPLAA